MKTNQEQIDQLINEINQIIADIRKEEDENKDAVEQVCSVYDKSARNLIHYKAFRRHDMRVIQQKLGEMGMARLTLAEGHVMASLLYTKQILRALKGEQQAVDKPGLSIRRANQLLAEHTHVLLGGRNQNRRVRIMVTQPIESAYNYDLVYQMIEGGMTCARINCAHDGADIWLKIIQNIKKASTVLKRDVKITMDLAGPKIRTGAIAPGARVRKFSPERDEMGQVVNPATIILVPHIDEDSGENAVPVDQQWLNKLEVQDKITLKDTRCKDRKLKVMDVSPERVVLHGYDTSYLGTGTVLCPEREGLDEIIVGELPPVERSLLLRVNDYLTVHKDDILGEPAQYDEDGNLLRKAHIGCQLNEIFGMVQRGERVLFDDGKIEGIIEETREDAFEVRITRAKDLGAKLKSEKGINFPTTSITTGGLTNKDREDLKFVSKYADVVNFSFVNSKEDVEELLEEFRKLDCINRLSVILKIETRSAFDNLKAILLAAMQVHYVGVMIARGDLAVETGWNNIGWVQNEILSLCNAAHIPVVWATQVLENLAKKGLPSRSEITDATTSLRAECVMLNKGPYITHAIRLLNTILTDMENYQEKNAIMLPQMAKLI